MATVTGLTAPRMLEIEANSIVDGSIDENGHLQLVTHGGEVIDAGKVKGDKGDSGGAGPAGPITTPAPEPIAPSALSVTSNTAFHTPAQQPMATVKFHWNTVLLDIIGDVPAIDRYELWYREISESNPTLLAHSETNSATVTTMEPGVTFKVKVRAHTYNGGWGAYSSEITVTPAVPASDKPATPGNVFIAENTGVFRADGRAEAVLKLVWDEVNLSVDDAPIGIRTYEIWLTSDGNTAPIQQTPENEIYLSFPSGYNVELSVRAMSNYGIWSDLSESDTVATDFPPENPNPLTIPILTTTMGIVYSAWDGAIKTGPTSTGPVGPEFQHLITEVASSSTGPWVAQGVPAVVAGTTASVAIPPGTQVWVRFRWRDRLGRVSVGISPSASITSIGIVHEDLDPDLSSIVDAMENAVISVITEYAVNSSETVAPTTGWSTTSPARTPGTFVWMRMTTTYADETVTVSEPALITGNTGASGGTGTPGKGISSTAVTYQVHTNGTTAPTGTWVASPPATSPGQFLWTRTITTYTDTTTTTAYSVAAHGASGTNGVNGVGVTGTVVTYQVHTSPSIAPTGTWLSSPAATAPGQYLWTRTVTTYSDSSNATAYSVAAHGATGATGSTGTAGKGISATTVTYQVHTSGTVAPTGTWTTTPGATSPGQFLWTRTVIDYTDSTSVTVYGVSAHGATGSTGSTGSAGTDATTVQVGNDAVAIPTDTSGTTTQTFAITIPFSGWIGNARAAATIAASGLPTGITAGTNTPATSGADGSLILNVASASTLGGGAYGEITLTVTCNSKVFTHKFTWSKAPTGATGSTGGTGSAGTPGTSATSIDVGNEAVVIPTDAAGNTVAASTITVPFTGFVGATRTATTVAVSGLPTGITVNTNTAGTSAAAGSLVLSVASGSALGGTLSGDIVLTVTCNAIVFTQTLSWSKATAGATGSTGSTGGTGAAGVDATNVVVGNDAVAIPTDPAGATTTTHILTIPFSGWVGNARAAATIVATGLPTGITAGTNTPATTGADGSLILNVASGSTLGGTLFGEITLTITCNSKAFVQKFSWSKAPQGATGSTGSTGGTGSTGAPGTSATSIDIGNEAVVIPCTTAGLTTAASTITVPFTGYLGNTRVATTVSVSGLPTGITVQTNTAGTTSADGSLVLAVASGSALGGTDFGNISMVVTANGIPFSQTLTWSKALAGATGSTGSTGGTGAAGADATTVQVGNDAVALPTDPSGNTVSTFAITIPFSGWIGNARAAATIAATGLPTGITAGTNTAATSSADGSLILNVANGSALGGTSYGEITLTVTCNSKTFTQKFTWSKAPQGSTGGTGASGKGISSTVVEYQASSSGTVAPTGTWVSSPPAVTPGQYLWTRTIITYTDTTSTTGYSVALQGATGATGSTGGTGAAGKGISTTVVTYQADVSGTVVPVGTWVTSPPVTTPGQYLWTRTVITYTDATNSTSYAISKHGDTGATGSTGAPGTAATSINVGNEAVVIPCTSAGLTSGASTITIPFVGYVGTTRVATTIVASGLPTGITVQTNTAGTAGADGSLVLAVAAGSTLGGTDFGNITLTVTANAIPFVQSLTWSKALAGAAGATGGTGPAGADATHAILGSDSVSIPTDSTGTTASTFALTIPFSGWVGNARAAATIAATGLPSGITAGTNTAATNLADGSLILNVASGSTLGGTANGEITLTVTVNSKTFTYKYSWAKAPAGATGSTGGTGSAGVAATSIDVGMSSAVIPTDAAGNTVGASTITIPFTGFIGATRAAITVVPTGMPTGITVGTNTAGTAAAAGSLVLSVAGSSSLGGTTSGVITLTLVCNGITFVQTFTWSKALAGATGSTGSTGGTGPAGADATHAILGSDSVSIPTDSTGTTASTFALTIPFSGWIGNARAAATIAATGLPTGITAGTNTAATSSADGSLILNVASASTLGGTANGEITLTITVNSKTFTYKYSWAKALTGATGSTGGAGSAGAAATSIDVGMSSAVIPTDAAGNTVGASSITIPFTGFIGAARAAITVTPTGLPTGITVGTNTAGTTSAAGSLVLSVASASSLGGTTSGVITLTLLCNGITFVQTFTWSKAIAGATGSTGSAGGTGAAGADATYVTLGNDAVSIPTDATGTTASTFALTVPFAGYVGNARAAATIVASGLPAGITAGTNTAATSSADGSLILNVASGSTLGGTSSGEITLTVTCNAKVFTYKFSWAKAPAGSTGGTGSAGVSATSVDIGNEAVVIPCNAAGATLSATTITIPFTGFIGATRAAATVVATTLPTGITVQTNTPGTTGAAGTLILAVAAGSTLGGTTTGDITLTVTVNSIAFVQLFSWSKGTAGNGIVSAVDTYQAKIAQTNATPTEIRRNLFIDPRAKTLANFSTSGGTLSLNAAYVGPTTTAVRTTVNTAVNARQMDILTKTLTPNNGLPVRVRFRINTSAAFTATISVRANINVSTIGPTTAQTIGVVALPIGETIVDVSGATLNGATLAATSAFCIVGAVAVGTTIDVTEIDIEYSSSASKGTGVYFDGSTVMTTASALTTAWTGTADASQSIMSETGYTVPPTGTWSATIPPFNPGDYLWTKTVTTFTDGTSTTTYQYTLQGGRGVSSVTPYYLQNGTGVGYPPAPTTNPPGGSWVITEPAYLSSTELYQADLYVFTDATFGWTSVSKVSAYTAATQALTAANLADAAAHGMVKASQTDPGHAVGRIWMVLDVSGNMIGIKISDGSTWSSYAIVADALIVPSSLGTTIIRNGAITGPKVDVVNIWADNAWLTHLRAGKIEAAMVTSTFGQELTLESNSAVQSIITTQTVHQDLINNNADAIADTNSDVTSLGVTVGEVKSDAGTATQAATDAAALAAATATSLETVSTWFRVDAAGAHIGASNNKFQAHVLPGEFNITQEGIKLSWWTGSRMVVPILQADDEIVLVKHKIERYPDAPAAATGTVIRAL